MVFQTKTLLAVLILAACAAPSADGQSAWTLTTADFRTDPVVLRGIDSSGVHVAPISGGEERVIPLDQFLEVTRPAGAAQPTGRYTLHMLGGDRLGGEPVSIKGNNLVWNSSAVGEISIPMKRLVAITPPGKPAPDTRQKTDVVTLANGDTLKGIVATLGNGKVSVQTDAGSSEVGLDTIASINFAATANRVSANKDFRVRFDDGSSVVAPTLNLKGDSLQLNFGKEGTRHVDLKRVVAIEQVNGPVSWLSTRPPAESVYIPYFGNDALYPARMDTDYKGDEIRFRDRHFARGIGVHAYSRLAWDLDGSYAAFRTRYAIDGDAPLADVTVRVKLDDKVVYEQQHVRAGTLSAVVLIDVSGGRRLTLETDFGDNGPTQDRLNWIEPALLKTMPAPETQPAPETEPTPETQPTAATQPTPQPATPAPTSKE